MFTDYDLAHDCANYSLLASRELRNPASAQDDKEFKREVRKGIKGAALRLLSQRFNLIENDFPQGGIFVRVKSEYLFVGTGERMPTNAMIITNPDELEVAKRLIKRPFERKSANGLFTVRADGMVETEDMGTLPVKIKMATGAKYDNILKYGLKSEDESTFRQLLLTGSFFRCRKVLAVIFDHVRYKMACLIVDVENEATAMEGIKARASDVFATDAPLAKLSQMPSFYVCKSCPFNKACHEREAPDTCKACKHLKPAGENGLWCCTLTGEIKDDSGVLETCPQKELF